MPPAGLNGRQQFTPRRFLYTGTDTLQNGYAMCFDSDAASAALRERVEKPSIANLVTKPAFAGVVVNAPAGGYTNPNGAERMVDILTPDQVWDNVPIYTDESIVAGDILGPLPGLFQFGRGLFLPIVEARETLDKSGTAGRVNCQLRRMSWGELLNKMYRFVDDFDGNQHILDANATPAEILGLGYQTSGVGPPTSAYTSDAGGRLAVTPITTGLGQLRPSTTGFPFLIGAGKSALFRAKFNSGVAGIDNDVFIGLSITGATIAAAGTVPALDDYVGFYNDGSANANWNIATNKDNGTDSVTDTGADRVADTIADLILFVRNRKAGAAAGAKTLHYSVDGAAVQVLESAAVAALINDDEHMGMVAAGITNARVWELDFWEGVINR